MDQEGTRPRRHRSRALRDLLLLSLAGLVVFWLGAATHAFQRAHEWISSRFPGQDDEIVAGIGRVALVFLVFSIIRWREVRRQIRARNAAEHRYRTLVEGMPVVTYVAGAPHEATASLRYVAPGIRELLGYSQDEWIADPDIWKKRLHPEDRESVAAEADRVHEKVGPVSMEYRMMAKDGRIVWVRDEAVVVERDRKGLWNVWQGVLMDITERKQAEERFLEAETRYRSLVETIPAVTYVDLVDELSTTVYVSPQIETMLGYTPKHWREDTTLWMRAVHPKDLDSVIDASARHNQTGEPYDQEYRIRTADDRWLWVRDQATIVRSEDGRSLFSQGVMFDVTERKLAEEALRESEQARPPPARPARHRPPEPRDHDPAVPRHRPGGARPAHGGELRRAGHPDHPTRRDIRHRAGRRAEDRADRGEPPVERDPAHAPRRERLGSGPKRGRRCAPDRRRRRGRGPPAPPEANLEAVRPGPAAPPPS